MTHDALRLSRAALDDDDDADNALSPLCRAILSGEHRDVRPRRDDQADEIADLKLRLAKLEAANKRAPKKSTATVSRRDFEFAIETIGGFVGKELDPILERLTKLETQSFGGVRWVGTWFDGMNVREGELCTDRGSLWLCTSPSNDRPGDNASAFRLIVKNGHAADGTKRHTTTGVRQ